MAPTLSASPNRAPSDEVAGRLVAEIPYLRGFARALTRDNDAADELVEDALARGWNSRGSFASEASLRPSLFTILRNRFLEKYPRAKAPSLGNSPLTAVNGHVWNSNIEFEEMARAYWQLPFRHREILMLAGALGLGYDEAACILGCTVSTVRSRLSRARDELQTQIEEGVGRKIESRA